MTHLMSQLRSRRPGAKTSKSKRRAAIWPLGECALRAQTKVILGDIAFVLHLARSLKQELENEKATTEASKLDHA